MTWTLWYEDGSTFTSEEGTPNDSPMWGLICIGQPGAAGRDLLWNETYYIFRTDTGEWSAHDLVGFVDQSVHYAPLIECVRIGRDTQTSRFKAVVAAAAVAMRGR